MNIFFLHKNPRVAARLQVRKSAIKAVLESAQMLSTAVRYYGYDGDDVYKSAYVNHPSSKWARANLNNFWWLCVHAQELLVMYREQSGKHHKSSKIIHRCSELFRLIPEVKSKEIVLTAQDLAIKSRPEGLQALLEYEQSEQTLQDAIRAYQKFYFTKPYVLKAQSELQDIIRLDREKGEGLVELITCLHHT